MKFFDGILNTILNLQSHFEYHKCRLYDIKHVPSSSLIKKVNLVRSKEIIKVAFVIYDIAKWKSEDLYLLMKTHPRFDPIIVPVMIFNSNYKNSMHHFQNCIDYLDFKKYDYIVGNPAIDIDDLVSPDIVFYGELYEGLFHKSYTFKYNCRRKSLACYIPYCFHNTNIPQTLNHFENNLIWLGFIENTATLSDISSVMTNHAINHVATGLPIQDSFIKAATSYRDVWTQQPVKKKKIIWAPSHTIKSDKILNAYEQSTFLSIADDMIDLAIRYREHVQFAFKPHPVLKPKLLSIWGEKRTEEYYNKWNEIENTQLEEGQYVDLFMSSDAMIHDCMSFMVEYLFTDKPVMFLNNGVDNLRLCNTQTIEAYKNHYYGKTISDIQDFIDDVVLEGRDTKLNGRLEFKQKYLMPPYGKSASANIINALLGIADFKVD